MTLNKCPIVEIHWIDSYAHSNEWCSYEDIPKTPFIIKSVRIFS